MKEHILKVIDCEHEGDMSSARNHILNHGGTIVEEYWDGEDCGEAYIIYKADQATANNIGNCY